MSSTTNLPVDFDYKNERNNYLQHKHKWVEFF
jgi:hypothetical protein